MACLARLQHLLDVFAAYDILRLETYQSRGDAERIEVRRFGRSVALRFAEVGYFNRVYHVGHSAVTQLPGIMHMYRHTPHPVELIPSAGVELADYGAELTANGFRPSARYARLSLDLDDGDSWQLSSNIEVRRPIAAEHEQVLDIYLRGFDARPENHATAKANMRLLFRQPSLHLWIALVDCQPVSLGMLYHADRCAFLCGGATLPEFRNHGCHQALIHRRFHEARLLGCDSVVSWAVHDSQSFRNMQALGFDTIAIDQGWLTSNEHIS